MRTTFCLLPLLLFSLTGQAISLGSAGQYDLFVLNDMQARRSDVEGKMAVGGDLILEDYAVGSQLTDQDNFKDTLIVGGNIHFHRGRVYHGNVVTGGSAELRNFGLYDTAPHSNYGTVRQGNPLNFTALEQNLRNRSEHWSTMAANGTVRTEGNDSGWRLFLEGNDPWFNIFSLDSDLLDGTDTFYLDVPLQSTVLINVDGIFAEMSGFGFYRKLDKDWIRVPDNKPDVGFRHNGDLTRRVMFNFPHTRSLELHSIGIMGSILAPLAQVNFYNGHIDGNLIAGSLTSPQHQYSGQVNHYIFIPEPSTIWMIILALGPLGVLR